MNLSRKIAFLTTILCIPSFMNCSSPLQSIADQIASISLIEEPIASASSLKKRTVDHDVNDVKKKMATSHVTLQSITPNAEENIAYIARVSNPANQENEKIAGLLKYCIKNKHWSVFEQASMTLEIDTNRGIGTQILRHRSFKFQQFSQRYADNSLLADEIPLPELRRQDNKNRQNSIDNLSEQDQEYWNERMKVIFASTMALYKEMLAAGIAKESARFILPEVMPTRMYMTGDIRSWIHYLDVRSANGTQKEHMEVAQKCRDIFIRELPIIAEALGWQAEEQA